MDKEESKIITKKIIVSGIVQGVGFRPLTFRIANNHDIKGTVQNIGGMVEIITQSNQEQFDAFLEELVNADCEGCEIINIEISDINFDIDSSNYNNNINNRNQIYDNFQILGSSANEDISIIPPDMAMCKKCEEELFSRDNRRYFNPFISCMSCGPRYTIINNIPYDRDNTTMDDFVMCKECNSEYSSPDSRRFHAQTISCFDCGPYIIFKEYNISETKEVNNKKLKLNDNVVTSTQMNTQTNSQMNIEMNVQMNIEMNVQMNQHETYKYKNRQRLEKAINIIKNGGIIAVKGVGGYHFVCSPFIEQTVQNLRKLKGREEKPFAVMFESVDMIKEYCDVSKEETMLLESKARPIVLLYSKNEKMAKSTYKGSIYCGAFLPYTPLQMLLIRFCGPLIMTSANVSNQPIIKDDDEMLALNHPLLDGVLYNTRRILRSVDDSVAKIIDHKAQLVRRSRGYVPYPVFLPKSNENLQIFAAGGDLKAAFCLYNKGNAVVSQYLGDLEENSIYNEYKSTVTDLTGLLKMDPNYVVCDMHPNYFSSRYAKSLNLKTIFVQHHHAHIASVMAEHHLNERIIGIAFDGTGYGVDGNIWGGEFMICEGADFKRVSHLKYAQILGGDQSMKDAHKTATCFLLNVGLQQFVNDSRSAIIEAAIKNNINKVLTSSMGRLFDAVSSILDIVQENHYEGECAAYLEKEALLAEKNGIEPHEMSFQITQKGEIVEIDPTSVLYALCSNKSTADRQALALGFHYAVADVILEVCNILRDQYHTSVVAFSGGVFQNSVLTNRMLKLLREDSFQVYYNIAVPPNDGCISLGQAYIGLLKTNTKA